MAPRRLPELKHDVAVLPPIESRYISRVPFIAGFIGATGSGKSHLALSLIKLMRREKTITKIYCICPTIASNVIYKSVLKDGDWVFSGDLAKVYSALREVESDCEAVSEQYRKDLMYQIVLNKFKGGSDDISDADENLLEQYGYRDSQPIRPCPVLIIDDCSHSELFSRSNKNPLTNLVLRSRHVGDGLGLSICLIAQTYTSGVPRALRQNLTHLALFRTQSEKEIKSMYEECSGVVSFSHFKDVYSAYTQNKHSYLWVDNIKRVLSDSF
jgi:energy-coupling factor transporter ATP-binding protein EcfA2